MELFKSGGVCMDYHFKKKEGMHRDAIIFCKKDQIFELNFDTG